MKKLFGFLALSAVLVLASCSKDQKVVNRLEGKWVVEKSSSTSPSGGVNPGILPINSIIEFNKCKLKKDGWCNGKIETGTVTRNFDYKVTSKGKSFVFKFTPDSLPGQPAQQPIEIDFDIVESTDSKLELKGNFFTVSLEMTLKKK